jgi:hypothetical protein
MQETLAPPRRRSDCITRRLASCRAAVEKSVEQVRFTPASPTRGKGARSRERDKRRVAERTASYGDEDRATTVERLEREMREGRREPRFREWRRGLRDQLFELKAKADGNVARSRGAFADIRAHS